nr:putative F-box protein At3g16210 [Ziziphus jujuba var. spinosa]
MAEDFILKDIIDNILERVSFEDLARFKSVCKSWSDSIIPGIYKSCKLIVSSPTQIQIVDHDASSSSSSSSSSNIKWLTLPLKEGGGGGQYVVGSSNGYLCIGFVENYNLMLWNSLTNEYKNINPPPNSEWINDGSTSNQFTGFGYDIVSNDYKIVKKFYPSVMVYSLKTNSWRQLKIEATAFNSYKSGINEPNIGTLVNGALYWFVTSGRTFTNLHERDYHTSRILRLDLAYENYTWVELPPDADESIKSELIVFQENLLCACQNHVGRMMIDMRNGEVLLHVRNEKDPQPPSHLQNGGLCLYNPKQKKFKWFEISENIRDWQYVLPTYENFRSFQQ